MLNLIDTRHGTSNKQNFSNGNCLPYTGVPFGMNYFAPQTTDQNGSWWFHPDDCVFQGYRLTHQPSPWMSDFSHFLLTPYSGEIQTKSLFGIQSSYRPKEAVFKPTHLEITQNRFQINSRLIPSMYGGILELKYSNDNNGLMVTLPGKQSTYSIINKNHLQLKIKNFTGCEDSNFTFYVTIHMNHPSKEISEEESEDQTLLFINFGNVSNQTIQLGTSFISSDQAELNFQREATLCGSDYLKHSQNVWTHYLQRIQVNHQNFEDTKTFYHNLYRVFLFPQTFYEIDEHDNKIHYDTFNQKVQFGSLYTNNGFWDTYKTVYPLFSLIAVDKYEDMLEGFLNSYREAGFLPKWLSPDERGLMPGTLIDAVIADAAEKGIRYDLMPEFLEAMKKSAMIQSNDSKYGRQGTNDYLEFGYVPSNHQESVNHTLDYAYSDFCISKVCEILQDSEKDYYRKRALNYQNIFDKKTKFMRAKNKSGLFSEDFSPYRWGHDYAEGSAWQSSFAVFQDFQGLIKLHGGKKYFLQRLTELFNQFPKYEVDGYGIEIHEMSEMSALDFGQFAISNQPSFHFPFLYSYIGRPEMAQPLLKNIMTECFNASPKGYPGDEDNGSMAGWYIFNSLGFYPVTPGTGEYVIGIPLVKNAVISLSNGKKITINTNANKPQQVFINEIKMNKSKYKKLFFKHNDLLKGPHIFFQLGIVPTENEYTENDFPYSISKFR